MPYPPVWCLRSARPALIVIRPMYKILHPLTRHPTPGTPSMPPPPSRAAEDTVGTAPLRDHLERSLPHGRGSEFCLLTRALADAASGIGGAWAARNRVRFAGIVPVQSSPLREWPRPAKTLALPLGVKNRGRDHTRSTCLGRRKGGEGNESCPDLRRIRPFAGGDECGYTLRWRPGAPGVPDAG